MQHETPFNQSFKLDKANILCHLTLSQQQILELKELADDNLKLNENSRIFSKWVENTVGKGEIARYEQFLLFPRYFQKTCTADTKNQGLFGKGLTHYHTMPHFDALKIYNSGSKKFQSSYLSSCHFALILQLDKEGLASCPRQNFYSKGERTSGFFRPCSCGKHCEIRRNCL